jgi:signal peptidase II
MAPKHRAFLVAFILSLGLDQWTKIWARKALQPIYPQVVTVIADYFEFRYSENTGSAFGLLRNVSWARYLFFSVGVIALAVVWQYLRRARPSEWRLAAELGLLAGGAIGNIIDRALFAKVTDFIVWRVGAHEWPTFNIADAALLVGIFGLLFDLKPPEEEPGQGGKASGAAGAPSTGTPSGPGA